MGWGKPISILLLVVLAGCAAPTPSPVTLVTIRPVPTNTFVPTETSIASTATAMEVATATSYPPLSTNGTYLAYLKQIGGQTIIVFQDSDGEGRKEILLPADISQRVRNVYNVSPDGKWLVYYTGSPNTYDYSQGLSSQGPFDLSLNLFNPATGESRFITRLLSDDFPNNFRQQVDIFSKTGFPEELSFDINTAADFLYGVLMSGIHASAWSSDGRYLAFAGQMNGLSSDLYVYDMESQAIRQLSSGPEELQWIVWTPDGKSILHGSTYEWGEGITCNVYVADLDGSFTRHLSSDVGCYIPDTWLDDDTYIEYNLANGLGAYGLRSVNTRTGAIVTLWAGSFNSFAVDLSEELLAVSAVTDNTVSLQNDNFRMGLYLVSTTTGQQTRFADGPGGIEFFGFGERTFVVYQQDMQNFFLTRDGILKPIEGEYNTISLAPNKEHWVGIGNKISIFAADDTLVREATLPKAIENVNSIQLVTWSPDSSGFFFSYWAPSNPTVLYYFNISTGDPILVENDWPYVYRWITPRP